jgi:hypothetical protein
MSARAALMFSGQAVKAQYSASETAMRSFDTGVHMAHEGPIDSSPGASCVKNVHRGW